MKRLRWVTISLAGFLALWAGCEIRPADQAAWERDFDTLLAGMENGHANLDWLTRTGRVNPQKLAAGTRQRLRSAHTDREARKAIADFIEAFGDPHLRIEGWRHKNLLPRFLRPVPKGRIRIDYTQPPWKLLPAGTFASAIAEIGHGERAGMIRIEHFGQDRYSDVMKEARGDAGQAMRILIGRLAKAIEELNGRRVSVLLVDITGNGGGTDWADAAARMLTVKPLRYGGAGFVRHAHSQAALARDRSAIEDDLRRTDLSPAQKQQVETGLARLRSLEAEMRAPCNRRLIWQGAASSCSSLIETEGGGLLGYAAPGSLDGLAASGALFHGYELGKREGVWRGRLAILTDSATGSAAEQFAALLRDNEAAVVLGQPTAGAGCGYTNGGISSVLPHSGMVVRMPDCVRFRADGRNELEGIHPDIRLDRQEELLAALSRIAGQPEPGS